MNYKNQEKIIEVCSILAEKENLKATISSSGKGAFIAGMGVFFGGILGGPAGMAVGGTITSIAVAYSSRGQFKSVVEIIGEMSDDQKRRLGEAVGKVLNGIRPEDWVGLLSLVLTGGSIKEAVLKEIASFLMKELNLKMLR